METDLRKQIVNALGNRNQEVATAIKNFCIQNELTSDMRIYFNDICWDFDSDGKYEVLKDIKGSEYFEYADDEGVSVSTEGGLYDALNGSFGWALKNAFDKVLDKFNAYYELGNAWNFTIVFNDDGE